MSAPEVDPLRDVKVGDPVPEECLNGAEACAAQSEYYCTRDRGHPGQHIAAAGAANGVFEVWS